MQRKAGVATDAAFAAFVAENPLENIVVVDARNPDFSVEPGDAKWGAESTAPIAGTAAGAAAVPRPRAVNLVYDRVDSAMDLKPLQPLLTDGMDTPIITHCGGGGRGQKAKLFLESAGYTNVINGGGPKVRELWEQFGAL